MDCNHKPIYQFRIVFIGDCFSGKSTLIASYINEKYVPSEKSTVVVDFFSKTVELDEIGIKARLQIWDTGGQERFKAVTQAYYRRCLGVILVYDVTERSSFEHLVDWLHEAKRYAHDVVFQELLRVLKLQTELDLNKNLLICVLVACKCDLDEKNRIIEAEEGKAFADFHNIDYIETSAKELYNVEKVFKTITKTIYKKVEKGELRAEVINSPTHISVKGTCDKKKEREACQFC